MVQLLIQQLHILQVQIQQHHIRHITQQQLHILQVEIQQLHILQLGILWKGENKYPQVELQLLIHRQAGLHLNQQIHIMIQVQQQPQLGIQVQQHLPQLRHKNQQ